MRCLVTLTLALGLSAFTMPTMAETTITRNDGFVMGAGQWTCAEVVSISRSDDASRIGQMAGWILGFWSSATFARETSFVDTVERVGGNQIYTATVAECETAPGSTLLHVVVRSMIRNTK